MSRIGKKTITIPEQVTAQVEGGVFKVTGIKGTLEFKVRPEIEVKVEGEEVVVTRRRENKLARALHGTTRQVIANMVLGVCDGWTKDLEVIGTGYRVQLEGTKLVFSLGFSHKVEVDAPEGVVFKAQDNKITVSGIDKVLVGQIAAKIRAIYPPDSYKGKGIRYKDEQIKLKPGKAAKGAGTAV